MRNNFTNYSQIKFYKNVLKLLKKHASIKPKHISLKFQGILPSYILNSFQKSMLLIPIKLKKQEFWIFWERAVCSCTPADTGGIVYGKKKEQKSNCKP